MTINKTLNALNIVIPNLKDSLEVMETLRAYPKHYDSEDKEAATVFVSVVLDSFEWCNGLPSIMKLELRRLVTLHSITFDDLMSVDGNDYPAAIKFKRDFIDGFCNGVIEAK